MSNDCNSTQIEGLIDRLNAGEPDARRLLLEHAYERLCRLANRMLSESFPALKNRHEAHSVVHETWIRLLQALETSQPPTATDFFRLAAHKIRQVLLDLADRQRKLVQREVFALDDNSSVGENGQLFNATHDPRKLAEWTEFHKRVELLETRERAVFEMHFYLEVPQSEIARLLELHPRKVSYLWVAATERLSEAFGGGDERKVP